MPSLFVCGAMIVLGVSGCAGDNVSLQSRIERKVENPEKEAVKIGPEHYNTYAHGFESPWPFGPYASF